MLKDDDSELHCKKINNSAQILKKAPNESIEREDDNDNDVTMNEEDIITKSR
jgi:hypothetical protein